MKRINRVYIETLISDFPITVAEKNVLKGIKKCPQQIPAISNNGLGI